MTSKDYYVFNQGEGDIMVLRPAGSILAVFIIASGLLLPLFVSSVNAEPPLGDILTSLGFLNVTESSVETFPAGSYEITLLAEFAGYHATNELSYYPVGTNDFTLLFSGPDGNNGYTTPTITKNFSCNSSFGLSMNVPAENHTYFTENWKNPDGQNHSKIFSNLNNPRMYLIGIENRYGLGDRDFNDMVFSLQSVKHYLSVDTEPFGITTIPGEGWYDNCTDVTLTAPSEISVSTGVRYNFSHWTVDGSPQEFGVYQITIQMAANHTAIAHFKLQHYLIVLSPFDSPGGEGWYNNGSTAYAMLSEEIVDQGNETRRTFTHWGGDSSGSSYILSDPIVMGAPKTAIAYWMTEYYLTTDTSPSGIATIPGEGWYEKSTDVLLTAPSVVSYQFQNWQLDGVSQGVNISITVNMDKPHTAIAVYSYIGTIVGGSSVEIKPPLISSWVSINGLLLTIIVIASLKIKQHRKTSTRRN